MNSYFSRALLSKCYAQHEVDPAIKETVQLAIFVCSDSISPQQSNHGYFGGDIICGWAMPSQTPYKLSINRSVDLLRLRRQKTPSFIL